MLCLQLNDISFHYVGHIFCFGFNVLWEWVEECANERGFRFRQKGGKRLMWFCWRQLFCCSGRAARSAGPWTLWMAQGARHLTLLFSQSGRFILDRVSNCYWDGFQTRPILTMDKKLISAHTLECHHLCAVESISISDFLTISI